MFYISTKKLLTAGLMAGPLFTLSWLIDGASREGYNPLRHPVSSLSIGSNGWIQAATFLIVGILLLGFSLALIRILRSQGVSVGGPRLLALCAIGLIGAGLFVCDPLSGYPSGLHTARSDRSISGILHDMFSAFLFIGYPIAAFKFYKIFVQKKESAWANYTKFSALAFICFFIVTSMGFGQVTGFVEYGGLFQRITLTIFWIWVTLISLYFLQRDRKVVMK
ncbi:DUF998 domain-containing protein [Planococcus shenhongbingii]|uniref:DUF998 domain-containing protein n=1 Tax=Planococcus shenhongbingii TaxID=3058398 RepID=UPI00260681F3|nr:DUF998 domain-containing protein [Planococcus sp. N016]WKA59281.1 DUF998 domain-containing protein [Planococcus sp. N016]